jgi:hypothetical protein
LRFEPDFNARTERDPLYAAYVLMLTLGLRRGEVLGLPWVNINLDINKLDVNCARTRRWERSTHGGQPSRFVARPTFLIPAWARARRTRGA